MRQALHRTDEPDDFGKAVELTVPAAPGAPVQRAPPSLSLQPASIRSVLVALGDLFRNDLHVEAPAADTDLLGSGLIDSMALVMLLLAIEDRFGTKLNLGELSLDDIRTPLTIAGAIVARLDRRPGQPAG